MQNNKSLRKDIKEVFLGGKVPPHAKEVEASIIGLMILNSKINYVVKESLSEEDFYVTAHRLIYRTILEIEKDAAPDLILIAQKIVEKGISEEIGGIYFLTKITDKVCSDANLKNYCLIVKQKSVQRRLIDFGAKILSAAGDETEDVFDLLLEAENTLKGINTDLDSMSVVSNIQIGMNVIESFDDKVFKAKNNIVDENAVYTFFPEWDEINGALFPGLYIVAGRPGMGKGVHMTELICRMGKHYDIGVVNAEMTDEQLMKRIGCNLLGIDNFLFKKDPKTVTEKEQAILHDAINQAVNLRFSIENNTDIHKVANKIRSWVITKNVKCVLIDFLTLMKAPSELKKYFTKTQEVDYVMEILRNLCKELNLPIIMYAQMNREILGRHGIKEPNLADLKASGSIEELAFQVMFLHRPEYYDEKASVDEFGEDIKGLMYQIIAKHRDGKTNVRLKMKADLARSQIKSWDNSTFINPMGDISGLPF